MQVGRRTLAAMTVVSALLMAGCGGASTSTSASSSGIPDPCTLLSASDTITPILGSDPGAGSMNAEQPEVSKVCLFTSGLILQVETADRYEEAVALILEPSTGATTQELTGVGDKALIADYGGGINQVVASNGEYWVGVTGVITADQATELATAMLAAI